MNHFICLKPKESRTFNNNVLDSFFLLSFNRKGKTIVNSIDRRNKIKEILFFRKHITTIELANEFEVSNRTIRRDIEVLSRTEGIYTVQGRYSGGIYVTKWFNPYYKKVTSSDIELLLKILFYIENVYVTDFSKQDVIIYKSILKNHMNLQ